MLIDIYCHELNIYEYKCHFYMDWYPQAQLTTFQARRRLFSCFNRCKTSRKAERFPIPGSRESCSTAFSTSLDGKFIAAKLTLIKNTFSFVKNKFICHQH